MRLLVTAQIVGEDGEPLWGMSREEIIVLRRADDDRAVTDGMLDLGRRLLDAIDDAKRAVSEQIAASVSHDDS